MRGKVGRRLVIIESPCAGDTALHAAYAAACLRDSIERGEAPFASHVLYAFSGALDDLDPDERRLGISAGFAWGEVADLRAFYVDLGMSDGMLLAGDVRGLPQERRRLKPEAMKRLRARFGRPRLTSGVKLINLDGMKEHAHASDSTAALGRLLRTLRTDAGMTLPAFAADVGCSARQVSRWEAGESWPTAKYLEALAKAHGHNTLSLLALLGQDEAA